MRYYKSIFIDKDFRDAESVKKSILRGEGVFNAFLIYVDPNSRDMFEIAAAPHVFKTANKNKDYGIIAVSKGYNSAKRTLKLIIEDWIAEHNNLSDIREYYNKNCI